jgi:hypothetical protein
MLTNSFISYNIDFSLKTSYNKAILNIIMNTFDVIIPVVQRFPAIRLAFLGMLLLRLEENNPDRLGEKPQKTKTTHKKSKKNFKNKPKKQSSRRSLQNKNPLFRNFFKGVLNLVIAISFGGLLFWQGPKLLFTIFPNLGTISSQELTNSVKTAQAEELQGDFSLNLNLLDEEVTHRKILPSKKSYKPPYNPDLPDGDWLIIPRIGVRSQLQQTENYEDALSTGIWWAPDFGKPGDRSKPMILAGHRYGFDWWWEDDYWKYHSFYLLPDLEPGDRIEVIADHRKWVYEVYAGEEGSQINDYQADLILYTCKHLDSPVRIFRYAKLVEISEESALGVLSK